MLNLAVTVRDGKQSAMAVREAGAVPAVVYGPKETALPIAVDARALADAWREAGQSAIVRLTGAGEDKDTLFREVQFHPVSGVILHADFYAPEKGKKLEVSVPLSFEGVSPAEKAGHVLVKALHEIEIEVAPAELPHELPVDISQLIEVGDRIIAAQIALPPSATLITDPEEIVASVTDVVEEKEEAPAPAPEAASPPAVAEAGEQKK